MTRKILLEKLLFLEHVHLMLKVSEKIRLKPVIYPDYLHGITKLQ